MATATRTKSKETPARSKGIDPANLTESIRQQLSESKEYQAACRECDRLRVEQAQRQQELDQLRESLGDTDELVAKIESGQQLSADDASDKVRILKEQIRAFGVAINRAERQRQKVLGDLSRTIAPPFQKLHNERIQRLVKALDVVCDEAARLTEIPHAMKAEGLTAAPSHYPLFHQVDLLSMRPRLKHISEPYLQHLGRK